MVRPCIASLLSILVVAASAHADDRSTSVADNASLRPVESTTASRGKALPALYVSFAATQAYDGFITLRGMSHGAVEANPLMAGIAGNSAAVWAVKGGVAVTSIYFAERLWRNHRRAEAIATMIVSNGLMMAVAAHNASVISALK